MQHLPVIKRVSPACDWDIFVGEDAVSKASSSENAGGLEVEMNVPQTGANVAVTQLKSNNGDEGQLVFFFSPSLLCCSVQEPGQSFKASSFLTLTQSEGERRRKQCPSPTYKLEIHHSGFCLRILKLKERQTIVIQVLHVRVLLPTFLTVHSHKHTHCLCCLTFPWLSPALYASVPVWHPIWGTWLSMHTFRKYSLYSLFICTLCFFSMWSLVLDLETCMLQQDVGFVLTRLISCRRRHRLIKIIPCYRGCFGQPNDTGGLLCSTGCSCSVKRRSSTTAST